MMPTAPMRMSRNVCWISSALTTGPTDVSSRVSSMGPKAASRAAWTGLSGPDTADVAAPVPGDASGTTTAEAPGEAGAWLGTVVAAGDALGWALAAVDAPGWTLAAGDGAAPFEAPPLSLSASAEVRISV